MRESGDVVDVVICGGGSAGSVLASRLSEDPRRRVLLVEAGPDTPPGSEPADVLDSYQSFAALNPAYQWAGLRAHLGPIAHNDPVLPPLRSYEQARILGGGSSINGQLANRGLPSDYADWERLGAEGWGWDDVLPFFRKLERDVDFAGPSHGSTGPIPIRRIMPERWCRHATEAGRAFAASGFPYVADQNGAVEDGYFPIAIANAPADHRVSTAMGYLDAAVRARTNLEILTQTSVRELVFDGDRVAGVALRTDDGVERTVEAGEVVVCFGAIQSPAFLMRNGIGPGAHLREVGIATRAHRAGVGRNLMDHPTIGMSAYLRRPYRLPDSMRRNIHVGLRYSSGLDEAPPGDMFSLVISRASWHPVGHRLCSILTWVNKSYSTGEVLLASPAAATPPVVKLNLLSDSRDLRRLMDGVRRMAAWYGSDALAGCTLDPFLSNYNERVRAISRPTLRNTILTTLLAAVFDGPAPMRRFVIENVIARAASLDGLLADEDGLAAFIAETVTGQWHASCTCRMGRRDDPMAVTDSEGRVYGIERLRVCDASLMPVVPSANTNVPTIMVAEKIAAAMRRG